MMQETGWSSAGRRGKGWNMLLTYSQSESEDESGDRSERRNLFVKDLNLNHGRC